MLESKYLCTYGLFATIPTLDGGQSVTQEILRWNETLQTSSKSRLFADGQRQLAAEFGLSERHILSIERLAIEPEAMLGRTGIEEQFDAAFFRANFWPMWCTTFAFQPRHSAVEFKRYLVRFSHMVGGFNRLEGIKRTCLNQYDSLVRPLQKWLEERGVDVRKNTRVADLGNTFRAPTRPVPMTPTQRPRMMKPSGPSNSSSPSRTRSQARWMLRLSAIIMASAYSATASGE